MKIENDYKRLNITPKQSRLDARAGNSALVKNTYAQSPSFTGGFDMFLRFLDTNQAWGANAVDLFCMVLPRTITDFGRGPEAGIETARREGMGTANHSLVGAYGLLAGMALAAGINGVYGFGKGDVKANTIFADAETINLQGKIYGEKLKSKAANPLREYINETLHSYEALSPSERAKWVKLKDADIEKVTDILEKEIRSNSGKISKDAANTARNILLHSFGAENNIRIIAGEGEKLHTSRYTVDYILENTFKLGKVFTKEKVIEAFKNSPDAVHNAFLKAIKSMNIKRSLAGIGVASAIGMSAQPLNMYLTKKKTGKEEFVGGGKKDDSTGFKFRKGLVAALFGSGVLATIGNPKNLIKDLQFKGFTPTIKQFKFIYGITIMSRFLSSRNDNELREATIKDTLGFVNWLILGNFVQKLVAQAFDKSLIKMDVTAGKNKVLNWIQNSALKTRDEVLHSALGDKVFGKDGKALSFNEMLKELPKNHAAKKQLRILTAAQLIGYAYSALILGRGIPKLNIYITNKVEAKKAAKEASQKQTSEQQPAQIQTVSAGNEEQDNMLKPENIAFLNQKNFTGYNFLNK